MQSEYNDEIYNLLLHIKNDLGADIASMSYFEKYKFNPVIVAVFSKLNVIVKFDLNNVECVIKQFGYEQAKLKIDTEIYNTLKKMGLI